MQRMPYRWHGECELIFCYVVREYFDVENCWMEQSFESAVSQISSGPSSATNAATHPSPSPCHVLNPKRPKHHALISNPRPPPHRSLHLSTPEPASLLCPLRDHQPRMERHHPAATASQETLISLQQLDPSPIESPFEEVEKPLPDLPAADSTGPAASKRSLNPGLGLSGNGHGSVYYCTTFSLHGNIPGGRTLSSHV